MKLSKDCFDATENFIQTKARPLEIAIFDHEFNGKPVKIIYNELKKYYNIDGGYGKSLEPDVRDPHSSALCTSIAFQKFNTYGWPENKEIYTGTLSYLLQNLDQKELHWRIIPKTAELFPHAPWWSQLNKEIKFNNFSLNPTAEILGYLFTHKEYVHLNTLKSISEKIIENLLKLKKYQMHDMLCCIRLLESKNLPLELYKIIKSKIEILINSTIEFSKTEWNRYKLRPIQIVNSPISPFFKILKDVVEINLDYEIEIISNNIFSPIQWNWGKSYPDEWDKIKLEWEGIITLEKLITLKKFNRIEGV